MDDIIFPKVCNNIVANNPDSDKGTFLHAMNNNHIPKFMWTRQIMNPIIPISGFVCREISFADKYASPLTLPFSQPMHPLCFFLQWDNNQKYESQWPDIVLEIGVRAYDSGQNCPCIKYKSCNCTNILHMVSTS